MSKRFKLKHAVALIAIVMCVAVLTSCAANQTASTSDTTVALEDGKVVYPVENDGIELTYWIALESYLTKFINSRSETDLSKELEKQTGIKIRYIHPPAGVDNERQAFNVMIASKDLPDIIQYNFNNSYPGGSAKAIKDNTIIPLDSLKQYIPDTLALLDAKPETKKYCVTDDKMLALFPAEYNDVDSYFPGPMIRGDLLAQLNLPVPETMDEWYTTLTKMKEAGIQYPLSWSEKAPKLKWSGIFTSAYDVLLGNWQKTPDNKVEFGAATQRYKEFLTEFSKWYAEGLIDPEFVSQDRTSLRGKIADGTVGSYLEAASGLTTIVSGWRSADPNTEKVVVGAPYPTLTKGYKVKVGGKPPAMKLEGSAAITAACKYPEFAAAYLNYGYTDDGAVLYNYGIEGKSYTKVDGKPYPADFILDQSLQVSQQTEPLNYIMNTGPHKTLPNIIPDSAAAVPELIDARNNVWTNVELDSILRMPELPPPTDKASRYSALYTDIDTYVDEMFVKFITGQEPISNFDQYVKNLNDMRLEECAGIMQEVLDGWNKR